MRVEVVRRYASKLPEHDPHPYRTGPWTPNHVEVNATELDVVAGELPRDLAGIYLRNTENPIFDAITGRYHPFDGDGMIHAIRFEDGRASYRNRFVKTAGLSAELEAGGPLWAGILESPTHGKRTDGWGARTRMKDASSTDVIVHAGKAITTFYQCGDPYLLDPATLETEGVAQKLHHPSFAKGTTMSAHPKVDEATGELLFFNYSIEAPYCHVGIADPSGNLTRTIPVPLPGPRLPHDMAFTERFVVIGDFPYFWEMEKVRANKFRAQYFPELGSRFAIVPRDGGAIRWFEASPTYVLHWVNAYEEGDEVVLEGYHQGKPVPDHGPADTPISLFMKSLDTFALETRLHRWRFNLRTGTTKEERLDDAITEFPSIHSGYGGRKHRYVYSMIGEPGFFLFAGLVAIDMQTGARSTWKFPKGVFASESPFCPRVGAKSENDGWVVTFTTDVASDASECQIFDATNVAAGPIARVRLPMRISSGTHATWMPLPR